MHHRLLAFIGLLVLGIAAFMSGPAAHSEEPAGVTKCSDLDDSYEPNDTLLAATHVDLNFAELALRSCQADDDWFSFDLAAYSKVQVDLTFLHSFGNIDLYLVAPNGSQVSQSLSTTNNEKVSYQTEMAGTYRALVRMTGPAPAGNTYDIQIGTCFEDTYENNDNVGEAYTLATPFNIGGLRVCPGDADWFELLLGQGDQVQINATFTNANGNIDLTLYDPGGGVAAVAFSATDNEKIAHTAATAGYYRIKAELFDGTPKGNQYSLQAQVTAATPTPTPTATETPAKAVGDVNDDGIVNAFDAAFILQFNAGLIPGLINPESADCNSDGTINTIDAVLILQYIAGLLPSLPP